MINEEKLRDGKRLMKSELKTNSDRPEVLSSFTVYFVLFNKNNRNASIDTSAWISFFMFHVPFRYLYTCISFR